MDLTTAALLAMADEIVYSDLLGMALALSTLYALRFRPRLAVTLGWLFVAATVLRYQASRSS